MLNNLNIKGLFLIVCLMSLFSIMTGGMSLFGMKQSNDSLETVYHDRMMCIDQLAKIKAKLLVNRLTIENSLLLKEETLKNIYLIEGNLIDIDRLWVEYRSTKATEEEKIIARQFEKDNQHLIQEGLNSAIERLRSGNSVADTVIKTTIRPLFSAVEEDINQLIQIQLDVARQEYTASQNHYQVNSLAIIVFLIIKLLLAICILHYCKILVSNVTRLVEITQKITNGQLDVVIPINSNDEIGHLNRSISQMQTALKNTKVNNDNQNWLKTGMAKINQIILGQDDKTYLASKVISEIANYIDAKIGVIYVANGHNKDLELTLLGTYAYTERKNLSSKFKLGEGLVGQAALERKQILLQNTPEDYIHIVSGLGETTPRNICVTPIIFDKDLRGVLEVGSLHPLTKIQLDYLNQVAEVTALAFEIAEAKTLMTLQQEELQATNDELEAQARVVEQSQQELRAQQKELQTINAELEIQMQRVKDSEVELKAQQEELELANDELKSKNVLLEQQKEVNEQARRSLTLQAEELTLASKYKSEFLANMSHELRTPLNSLLLLARSLHENKSGNLTEDQVETAGVIYDSGSDLLNLINEILDLSKIESGKMELRIQPVEINELIRTIYTQFVPMAKNQGLELNITSEKGLPDSIITDAQRLGQVINNLVGNALKFTENGSISIVFESVPNTIDLSRSQLDPSKALAIKVTDTGIGIPLDKQKIIFEAFQQADSGDRRRFGGTGLGLSISRELVNLLGGEIQLVSEQGQGSVFSIYIPFAAHNLKAFPSQEPKITRSDTLTYIPPVSYTHKTIESANVITPTPSIVEDDRNNIQLNDRVLLTIEDDLRFAKILATIGRERGFKCLLALTGEEGLQLAKDYKPDSIVLDLHLPKMDGWEVLTQLKQNVDTRHIPVHILSSEDPTIEGLRVGAIGHVRKPVRREDIEMILTRLEEASSSSEKRVLVVEDDELTRRETVQSIGSENVIVEEVDTGEKALQLIRERSFSLIILDLGLPDIQGMELLNIIAKEKINMPPVIVYTVRELTREEETALRNYANSIILKDVRSQERLIDEVALFLHRVIKDLPEDKKRVIQHLHESDEHLNARKVLIVEDDMRTMFAMSKILAEHGLIILKADNGEKALSVLNKHPDVDLVLMDLMMPIMDGYEASRAIRALPQFTNLPIIALTAKAMKEDRKKCIDAGASDYLTKPVDQDRLLSLIRVWLCR
ncbi:MAG: response regulator [Methylococcales bacterium]